MHPFFSVTLLVSTVIICLHGKNHKWRNVHHWWDQRKFNYALTLECASGAPAGVTALNFSNKKLTRIKLETTLSHLQFIVQMQCIFSLKFLLIPPRWRTWFSFTPPPSTQPAPLWTKQKQTINFPAHFLEFSWYPKSIFVLYLNNRLGNYPRLANFWSFEDTGS